jgi:hypothetical protein
MKTNYGQAALRHWIASGVLEEENLLQDAAYLAGYVGECGLKAAIIALGGIGNPKSYVHDLEALSGDVLASAALFSRGYGRYAAIAKPLGSVQWSPEDRYDNDRTDMETMKSNCDRFREAGSSLIFALLLDGLLEDVLC